MISILDQLSGLQSKLVVAQEPTSAPLDEAWSKSGMFIAFLMASVVAIIFSVIMTIILTFVLGNSVSDVNKFLPQIIALEEAIIAMMIVIFSDAKKLKKLLYAIINIFGAIVVYWQIKIGVWIVGALSPARLKFDGPDLPWLSRLPNFLSQVSEILRNPLYFLLSTVLAMLIISIITKRPLTLHFSIFGPH